MISKPLLKIEGQIKSWKENQGYLLDFLKYNNESIIRICLLLSYFKIF